MSVLWDQVTESVHRAGATLHPMGRLLTWWANRMHFAGITLGTRIYIRKDYWDNDRGLWIVAHELRHVEQFQKAPWTFHIKYGLLAPVLYNPFRTKYEIEAYKVQMMHDAIKTGKVPQTRIDHIVRILCGYSYAWGGKWCPTHKWAEQAAKEVENGR